MNIQNIEIPKIILNWSEWFDWDKLKYLRSTESIDIDIPENSGVYEARYKDLNERLTIGKTSNLRKRIIQGLVRGRLPHSSGIKIRNFEDLSRIEIRWAETDRPSCVEEELHKQYHKIFGGLPRHTKRT